MNFTCIRVPVKFVKAIKIATISVSALSMPQWVSAAEFTLTETLSGTGASDIITATFNGTANGDIVTNLSDISVYFDGVAYNGNGNLIAYGTAAKASITNAQVSFDGLQNNYTFENYTPTCVTEFCGNVLIDTTGFLAQYSNGEVLLQITAINNYKGQQSGENQWGTYVSLNYSLTSNATIVPVPTSIGLFATGLLGFVTSRRKPMLS